MYMCCSKPESKNIQNIVARMRTRDGVWRSGWGN